jgi:hypothetical protein
MSGKHYLVPDESDPNFRVSNLKSCKWALWGNKHFKGLCTDCEYPYCYEENPGRFRQEFEVPRTPTDKRTVAMVALRDEGYTLREIGERFNLSKQRVSFILKEFEVNAAEPS